MASRARLGFCPIGKFVFSHEDALRYKGMVEEKLRAWGVDYVSIDAVVEDGLLRSRNDVGQVVKHLRNAEVDALFVPHCNFGTEDAVGLVGRDLGVPVLLWGPRDEAPLPDGTRLRDSLCGVLASGKVLHSLGVPFTYIENCRVDDPPLREGLDRFLRAAAVVRDVRTMRIGQVGGRIDFFWTTIANELELLQQFNIQVQPIDLTDVIDEAMARASDARYGREIDELTQTIALDPCVPREGFARVLAFRDVLVEIAERERLTAFAIQCFDSVVRQFGSMVCYAMGQLADRGYPAACETDIAGAVSLRMLASAAGDTSPFFADLTIRHPDNDQAVLLWHCGPFPASLRCEDADAKIGAHFIMPGGFCGSCHWPVRQGPITVARFDRGAGGYQLAVGEGRGVDGPATVGTYVWLEVSDWPGWERRFAEGPFIHHVAAVHGQFASVLEEATRFLPGLRVERLP